MAPDLASRDQPAGTDPTRPPGVEAAFTVAVPFALRSKSNFRRQARSGIWAHEQAFGRDLGVLTAAARPVDWPLGERTAPLGERPAIVCVIVAASTLDTANLSKSVLDALEGVVYHTDAQVRAQSALSVRTRAHQRAVLAFAALDPQATLADLVVAAAWLTDVALRDFTPTEPAES